MLILTKNKKGEDQWWKVSYDKGYVYIEHHHHAPYVEKDIDQHLFTFDYSQIRIAPIIGKEGDPNCNDMRGTPKDENPFVIRGRTLGPVYLRVRKYLQSGLTGIFERASGGGDWNLTPGMREELYRQYWEQIKSAIESPDFEKELKHESVRKVIASLQKQINEKRKFFDEIEAVLQLAKYQV